MCTYVYVSVCVACECLSHCRRRGGRWGDGEGVFGGGGGGEIVKISQIRSQILGRVFICSKWTISVNIPLLSSKVTICHFWREKWKENGSTCAGVPLGGHFFLWKWPMVTFEERSGREMASIEPGSAGGKATTAGILPRFYFGLEKFSGSLFKI